MSETAKNSIWLAALALLMLMTRGELLGNLVPVQLHDASWAAFLLAGAVLRKPVYLVALATLALGLDYTALCAGSFDLGGCLKPSYPTLIASWALLWGAGRLVQTRQWHWAGVSRNLMVVLAAIGGAYLLTSGGFYLWSGFYEGWTLAEYTRMSASFFLLALGSTLGYTALGLTAHRVLSTPADRTAAQLS